MKRFLLILSLMFSVCIDAHQPGFKFFALAVHNENFRDLNIEMGDGNNVHKIPQGTYRICTNAGPTNKYVELKLEGAMRKMWPSNVCFYLKNTDGRYDQVFCIHYSGINNHEYGETL